MSCFDHYTQRTTRAILLVDIVDSTYLIEQNETSLIFRWLDLLEYVEDRILTDYGGHLIKSLGDGMMLDFSNVRSALAVAFSIQKKIFQLNQDIPLEQHILLRMSIELGEVIIYQRNVYDVYGREVMLAARLITMARPGDIIISARVRDQLTAQLDAEIEDLGNCFLKHLEKPVHVYRITPPGLASTVHRSMPGGDLLPTIAIIPFATHLSNQEHYLLGEILADDIINAVSRSFQMNVISRLSTTAFRSRVLNIKSIRDHLKTDYLLTGTYRIQGEKFILSTELIDVHSETIAWADRIISKLTDILCNEEGITTLITANISNAIMASELKHARSNSLPTLKNYTLLMAAIALMHRLLKQDFHQAQEMLQTLIDRATKQSIPLAWMANWHVLRVQQGWSANPELDGRIALEYTKRALDNEPDCELALDIHGFVHTNLLKQLDIGETSYDRALEINPNDALAWLLRGTLYAFKGKGEPAMQNTQRALKLTPLHPHSYFYDSLSATACLAAHQFQEALQLAQRSYRVNREHTSTLRAMLVAQWNLGLEDEARATVRGLLELEPEFSVSRWLRRSPCAEYAISKEWSKVMRQAGIPD